MTDQEPRHPAATLFSIEEVPQEPRRRWFVRMGDVVIPDRGFSTKATADSWITGLGRRLDWRCGYLFRLRGSNTDFQIVDRQGVRAQP